MTPVFADSEIQLFNADVFELLESLPPASVPLIATDPPYFQVKAEGWDNQWNNPEAFLEWVDDWLAVAASRLAPNGSLYVFASPQMATRVETLVAGRFNLLNRIVWNKPSARANAAAKDELRAFFPESETVLFAEHFGADGSHLNGVGFKYADAEARADHHQGLREYFRAELARTNRLAAERVTVADICRRMAVTSPSHYFARSQWHLPPAHHYDVLRAVLRGAAPNASPPILWRPHSDLQAEFDANKQAHAEARAGFADLRRPFFASPDRPYTDVWTFPKVPDYPDRHPTEKPAALMEHIVATSSRPGDLVVDPFAGSGATLKAAAKLGRLGYGGDTSAEYLKVTANRLAHRQESLFKAIERKDQPQ